MDVLEEVEPPVEVMSPSLVSFLVSAGLVGSTLFCDGWSLWVEACKDAGLVEEFCR